MNVIEMLNITKEFPGVKACDNVTLEVKKGEIHALLGENGAGKSTLMSILFGLYEADEGIIKVNGEIANINDPNEANKFGIGMVHQHFKLVQKFSVLENVVLGIEDVQKGFLAMNNAHKKVLEISKRYNFYIETDELMENISVGQQQRVEIIKILYRDNDILIFDEPTAVLTPQEIDELMEIMKQLIDEGKSIIFITHKLNEIKRIADRVTVLRKGQLIGTFDVATTSVEQMSEYMVGRKVDLEVVLDEPKLGDTILKVNQLNLKTDDTGRKELHDVSFEVAAGEILCVAGIEGNGQSELVYALTGLLRDYTGSIELDGQKVHDKSIRYRNTHGISHIPEDRHKHGLILDYSLEQNLVLQTYFQKPFQHSGVINSGEVRSYSTRLIDQYDIRSGQGSITRARSMSGGNQQKAIVAREIEKEHKLLIACQPTRGLDVGAIEYIHHQIISERNEGKGVLLISLELSEVLGISDRIIVMYEGRIVADLKTRDTNERELGLYMSGAKKMEVKVDA